jgi:hypothetical protein
MAGHWRFCCRRPSAGDIDVLEGRIPVEQSPDDLDELLSYRWQASPGGLVA